MVIAALVLAAGSGSRFGGTKQVAALEGKPLVRHAVDAALVAGITDVVVVVGHDADAVARAAGSDVRIVRNPRFALGQSTSLIAGIDALGGDVEAAVVLLADQPGITPEMVRTLLDASAQRPESILRLRFLDGPGPALLRRAAWDPVRAVEGDVGARALIERHRELVADVPFDAPTPPDIDTAADLDRLGAERDR